MQPNMSVRTAKTADWAAIWPIISDVAAEQMTFAMNARPNEDEMRAEWLIKPPGRVIVACGADGSVLGTANMYANRANQGAHVASGSLMVARSSRGNGVGRAMVEDLIDWAGHSGYRGIQFNAVVQTNHAAVHLYLSEGFRIVGAAPGAFHHPELGSVDLLMMWRDLP